MAFALTRRACLQALLLLPFASRAQRSQPDPRRIVAVNWSAAEMLLSLGITPLAISDSGYFRRRIPHPALPSEVLDIGPFWEPNMEMLRALAPSLIISDELPASVIAQMATIAPVETVGAWRVQGDRWTALQQWMREMGIRLDVDARARHFLQAGNERMTDLRNQLSPYSHERTLVIVLDQDGKHAMIYGKGTLADSVLFQLGLTNAWQHPVNALGIARVGIEQLAQVACERLFFTQLPTTMTRLTRRRQPDGLWQQLPLVLAGKTTELAHFFPFGGLQTALDLAQHIANTRR
jgi:ABC-type Fe3+-hydroxamate transport system substrate-binding protein